MALSIQLKRFVPLTSKKNKEAGWPSSTRNNTTQKRRQQGWCLFLSFLARSQKTKTRTAEKKLGQSCTRRLVCFFCSGQATYFFIVLASSFNQNRMSSTQQQDELRPTIVFSLSWDGARSFKGDTHHMLILQRHFLNMVPQQSPSVRTEISGPSPSYFLLIQDASMSFTETMNRRLKRGMQQLHSQPLSDFENEDADSLVLELVD